MSFTSVSLNNRKIVDYERTYLLDLIHISYVNFYVELERIMTSSIRECRRPYAIFEIRNYKLSFIQKQESNTQENDEIIKAISYEF